MLCYEVEVSYIPLGLQYLNKLCTIFFCCGGVQVVLTFKAFYLCGNEVNFISVLLLLLRYGRPA